MLLLARATRPSCDENMVCVKVVLEQSCDAEVAVNACMIDRSRVIKLVADIGRLRDRLESWHLPFRHTSNSTSLSEHSQVSENKM